MRRGLIYKICTGSLMFGSLMTNAMTADSYTEKSLLKYSSRLVAGQWNPWALPEAPEIRTSFQCPADSQSRQTQGGSEVAEQIQNPGFHQYQGGRFISPGLLESLKQQQMQTQMTPTGRYYYRPQQRNAPGPMTGVPEQSYYYGRPSYGAGSVNPLYDTPVVSPWGSSEDLVYRGGSFGALPYSSPWVPNEAVGGLPPMHVPPYTESSNWGRLNYTEPNNSKADIIERSAEENVFNPFTFVPNRSWP